MSLTATQGIHLITVGKNEKRGGGKGILMKFAYILLRIRCDGGVLVVLGAWRGKLIACSSRPFELAHSFDLGPTPCSRT